MGDIHDITAAALKRACDKSDAGELVCVKTGTPLAAAAAAKPGVLLIDGDWLVDVLKRMAPDKRRVAFAIARHGARIKHGRDDFAVTTGMLFELLKGMEADGELESFIGGTP